MIHAMMLEPLEERYTSQWLRWIPKALDELKLPWKPVLGKCLTSGIETGSVLDAHGTSYWKSTQMASLIARIYKGDVKDGDTVWFADLWNFDVLHLAYIRDLTGIKFKISGVLHAGSWDALDFVNRTGINNWCVGFELALFKVADEVHVGTEFHRDMILEYGLGHPDQIKVTGLFFDAKEVRGTRDISKKDPNLVVFCQRLDPEKFPEKFDELAQHLSVFSDMRGRLDFVKTRDLKLTKNEYYDLLAKATWAISFDGQETFGYTVLECMALGVTPLVANAKAYQETVPESCRWDTEEKLESMLEESFTLSSDELFDAASQFDPVNVARNMFL